MDRREFLKRSGATVIVSPFYISGSAFSLSAFLDLFKTEEKVRLTTPELQKGVVEAIIDEGAKELMRDMTFDEYDGDSHTFEEEPTLRERLK